MNAFSIWWATAAAVVVLAGAPPASPQDSPVAPKGVAGVWKVSLYGQHVIPVGMELTEDGASVSGTLMLWNGDVDLIGTLEGGLLKVAGTLTPTDGAPGGERVIQATLAADGTLAGTMSVGTIGQVKLTAERFRERPAPRATRDAPATGAPGPAAPFAGAWTLAVEMGATTQTFALEVAVDGSSITGTLASDHSGTLALKDARLKDGELLFAVQMTGTTQVAEFRAALTDSRSLTGTLTGPMGTLTFTGTRQR